MKKFWNYVRNDAGERILRLEGPIDEDNFWGDEVTPRAFREELDAEDGDITVYINSPGGNVFAAAEIYTMLLEHKGRVTVKIDAIAASAASVIAMAGEQVLMSPVAMLMIHDPMTIAMGNTRDMEEAINTLNEIKESIINAYQLKSGLNRKKISQLMEDETWLNAKKAVELGFADAIIQRDEPEEPEETDEPDEPDEQENHDDPDETEDPETQDDPEEEKENDKEIEAVWQPYSTRAMGQRVLNWLIPAAKKHARTDEESVKAEGDTAVMESTEAGLMDTPANEAVPEQAETPEEPVTETVPEQVETVEMTETPVSETVHDQAEPVAEDEKPDMPVIGMDGKTPDGAMPYEILKRQLDFLK